MLFLCNRCSTSILLSLNPQNCCRGIPGRRSKEWRQSHSHGGPRVAEWRHSGRHSDRSMDVIGRPKEAVQGRQKHRSDGMIMFTTIPICYRATIGRPLRPRLYVCLPPAPFERPVSNQPPQRPRQLWCPRQGLNNFKLPRQSVGLLCATNGDLSSLMVAQSMCKVGITISSNFDGNLTRMVPVIRVKCQGDHTSLSTHHEPSKLF